MIVNLTFRIQHILRMFPSPLIRGRIYQRMISLITNRHLMGHHLLNWVFRINLYYVPI